jgi:hypothetical protein
MLKGFFYRRMPENNQFPTDVFIRFEINSKESILAKVAYLSQAGIQFFLPRGKVILVPDERMLLILNSPEHGEFKIPSDVYYFCNINIQDGQEEVCYGVKFHELSVSTWEVILDFCGNQFPEITFLSPSDNDQATERPANQALIKPDSAPNALPQTETPFIPLPPLIPAETANVISNLVNVLHSAPKTERPVEPRKIKSIIPEMPVPAKIETSAPPARPSSASIHTTADPAPEKKTQSSGGAAVTNTPVHADFATVNKKAAKTKPGPNAISNMAATVPEHPAKSNPSSIQVLAASLATPPLAHTQPKAQSLSQEMIDRLIEKLQAEAAGEPTDPLPPAPSNPLPDHLRVSASEINDAYQNTPQPGQPNSVGKKITSPSSELSFTAPNIPGAPFKADNFQSGGFKQPETKSHSHDPAQPAATNTTGAVPFDPFKPFNIQSNPPGTAVPNQDGHSLSDLMNNLDSTISKNVTPVGADKPIQQDPVATAKTTSKTAPNISLAELKNMNLPYLGKETDLADVPKKTASPAPVAMTNAPTVKTSGTTAATMLKPEKATAPTLKKPAIGPGVISNAPGVSLDQKAIDKLVESLIQDMAADERGPTESSDLLLNLAQQATPLGNGMAAPKKGEPKISPAIPAENAARFSSPTNKGLNVSNFDHGNTRIMDQKSIDLIVKNLIESESGTTDTSGSKAEQPALANAIPLKPFTPLETKRTLDQKAIDQVVQALTQNFAAKNMAVDANNGAAVPFNNNNVSASEKPPDFEDKGKNVALSATSLSAVLLMETGEVLHAVVEQIYVGGLMVTIDRELPLNSTLKLNILGNGIHITDVLGTCTNCESAPSGKNGFVAEIFFKNMNTTQMEQFRTLIAKLNPRPPI